jgi:hypothetical protein
MFRGRERPLYQGESTMRVSTFSVLGGTPQDLVDAAGLGARIATRNFRAQGLDDGMVRRKVIVRFRQILDRDYHNDFEQETLMAAVQRAVEAVLAEPAPRHAPGAGATFD